MGRQFSAFEQSFFCFGIIFICDSFQFTGTYELLIELEIRRQARALTFLGNSLNSL